MGDPLAEARQPDCAPGYGSTRPRSRCCCPNRSWWPGPMPEAFGGRWVTSLTPGSERVVETEAGRPDFGATGRMSSFFEKQRLGQMR